MFLPVLFPGMKQSHNVVFVCSFRIYRCDIWTLLEITAQATQAEIAHLIGPQVLLGDNMIDLMR